MATRWKRDLDRDGDASSADDTRPAFEQCSGVDAARVHPRASGEGPSAEAVRGRAFTWTA
jgi:hypothetical protein